MTMKYLVTGANGYLGGELCLGLRRHSSDVMALARSGRPLDKLVSSGVTCATYDNLPDVIDEGDVIVHCAGKVCATGLWEDYKRINVDWAVNLFDQAVARGARSFIYISSVAALGYSNRDDSSPLDEDALPHLLDGELYGKSKWEAERQLRARAEGVSTRLVILRPGLVYGRRPFVTPKSWLRRGNVVDPGQRVPLVHVDSVLRAVLNIGENPEFAGTYHVADDEQPTLRELNALKRRLGILRRTPWPLGKKGFLMVCLLRAAIRRARGLGAPPAGYVEAQYAMQTRRLTYTTKRLRECAGWSPAYTLEAGLRESAASAKTPTSVQD